MNDFSVQTLWDIQQKSGLWKFLTPTEKEAFLSLHGQRLEQECISEEDIHASLNAICQKL